MFKLLATLLRINSNKVVNRTAIRTQLWEFQNQKDGSDKGKLQPVLQSLVEELSV